MHGSGVLVVLNNYARPQNMPRLIAAWRGQSVKPASVVVVDNTPFGEVPLPDGYVQQDGFELYPRDHLHGADDVWRWRTNMGCSAHMAPALMLTGHRYVLLADDDILPGSRALEHLLDTAREAGDRFATIGSVGRRFLLDRPPGERYSGRSCPPRLPGRAVPVHLTCQAHLVRSDVWHHVLAFRNALLGHGAGDLVKVHDDFLLCCGVQTGTRWPSLLAPLETDDPEKCLVKEMLPGHSDATAVWKRPRHFEERGRMVELACRAGWCPIGDWPSLGSVSGVLGLSGGYEIE